MLPEILLKLFVKSDGHYFIHFGSHYETNKDHVILDRLNYIESKALGSQVCKFYSQTDKRVKLLYLPTILNYNQPTGRFFIDFINSSINNSFFQISHPNSIIKVSSYDSFFQHLNKLLIFQGNASSFLPPEAVMSVLDFSNFLNTLLIKNALHPVRICTKNSHQIHISEREVDKGFAHKIEKMILKIYERIK
jgi:hypothetical protein